ncbi:MAG: lipoate--protein ligase family protein [Candidatus Omnitrophica bacterium]|nr:lipoate--protein ligase family protein [Candidatus Omnitrophota bacterium]
MKYIDLTLPTPEQNLACDEAMLELCEEGFNHEILRFWEPREYFVVLGYSNKTRQEVNKHSCLKHKIPILRRPSGGGTVLQGAGCLNYTLILKSGRFGSARSVSQSNQKIMEIHRTALERLLDRPVSVQGVTDLTLNGFKFSGNAQRRKTLYLLFHGTFLLNMNLHRIQELLPLPSKQPAYRKDRSHLNFLTNLKIPASKIKHALKSAWRASEILSKIPQEKIEQLVKEKYSSDHWNFKF